MLWHSALVTLFALSRRSLAADPKQAHIKSRFGARFCLYNTTSFIHEVNTTLIAPPLPNPANDQISLWPGIETPGGGLTQSLLLSYKDPGPHCNATSEQWCGAASAFALPSQAMGPIAPISVGDRLFFHYIYNNNTEKYEQTLYSNGKAISSFSYNTGRGTIFDVNVEAHDMFGQIFPDHTYTDTTIILDQADASWATRGGNPFYVNETGSISSSSAQPSTPDGGVTWHIPWITLHESDFSKNLPE